MSGSQDALSPEEHKRIFEEKILPESRLGQISSPERPRAIFLGGQPGSGKGGLVASAEEQLSRNVITVDTDELRGHHPRVKEFTDQNPLTWSGRTHEDASAWAKELGNRAVAEHKNVIFDSTLSNAGRVSSQIKDLRAQGYETEIRVVATHKLESEAGVSNRFTQRFDETGVGRHVPASVRDEVYDKLPHNLDEIHEKTGARIRIYDREGREWFDSHDHAETRKPSAALEQAREARLRDPASVGAMKNAYDKATQWHENLANNVARNPVASETAKHNLPGEIQREGVVASLRENAVKANQIHANVIDSTEDAALSAGKGLGGSGMWAGRALGTAGTGLMAYDAYTTAKDYAALAGRGNQTGADATLRQYEGRTAGGVLGGMGAGFAYGALAGSETGPGAVATGIAGGVIGGFAGDRLANKITEYKINHQTAPDGKTYTYDKGQWSRTEHHLDWQSGVLPHIAGTTHAAPDDQRSALDYKRTAAVTELALSHPRQLDTKNITLGDTDWHAARGTWTRQVISDAPPIGLAPMPITYAEKADSATAAKLDRIAADRQHNNNHYSETVAKAYVMDHYGHQWEKNGTLPDAVSSELHLPSENRVRDPATGKTWTADAHGAFSRTDYIAGPDGAIAVPVAATPDESGRLSQVRQAAIEHNASYGRALIHDAATQLREQATPQHAAPQQSHAAPAPQTDATAAHRTDKDYWRIPATQHMANHAAQQATPAHTATTPQAAANAAHQADKDYWRNPATQHTANQAAQQAAQAHAATTQQEQTPTVRQRL